MEYTGELASVRKEIEKELPKDFKYSVWDFEIPKAVLSKSLELTPLKSYLAVASVWATIVCYVVAFPYFTHFYGLYWAYLPFAFLIAGRQGALLNLLHDASHGLITPNKRVNHFIATWLLALPIGINVEGYRLGHLRHHSYSGTEMDPKSDSEKYKVADVRESKLYLLFLKDLLGISALGSFFSYSNSKNETKGMAEADNKNKKFLFLFQLCMLQLVVLAVFFQFNILNYILFWVYPAMGPHMVLMRVRGIGEHGLAKQMHMPVETAFKGMFFTRSFLSPANSYKFAPFNWLERALIGSVGVNFHHEHHLLPNVPFYNLPLIHNAVKDKILKLNPEVYARGYFSATIRNISARP